MKHNHLNMSLARFIVCFALMISVCSGDFEIPAHLKAHAELLHNTCVGETGVDEGMTHLLKKYFLREYFKV